MKRSDHNIFVTGTTGFLGSHFLLNHSRIGASHVYGLVRADNDEHAQHRVQAALKLAADSYNDNRHQAIEQLNSLFTPVRGDISLEHLGIQEDVLQQLNDKNITEFWHFASSLNFESRHREIIYTQNVLGAKHAAELAARLGAKRFIYVSTAYTCGKMQGEVTETLHPFPGEFNNYYEESKCEAENLLAELCDRLEMELIILRPSIVVGPLCSKKTGGSDTGVYGFIRELLKLKAFPKGQLPTIRIHSNPLAVLNIIPVDCIIDDIVNLIEQNFEFGNNIYHLCGAGSVPNKFLFDEIKRQLDLPEISLSEETFSPTSRIEKSFTQRITFYDGYVKDTKSFKRNIKKDWTISEDHWSEFIRLGIEEVAVFG